MVKLYDMLKQSFENLFLNMIFQNFCSIWVSELHICVYYCIQIRTEGVDPRKEKNVLSQRKYCLDLLESSGLLGSKPASTSLDTSIKLHQDTSKPFENVSCYRRLIGRLLYLNTTRPDISLATQQLSQFLNAPIVTHYKAGSIQFFWFFQRFKKFKYN